jgi:hypothetical protein
MEGKKPSGENQKLKPVDSVVLALAQNNPKQLNRKNG